MKALQTKNLTALACLLLWMLPLVAQENAAQEAVFNAHWLKHEYQVYVLHYQSYSLQKGDTIDTESLRCSADVMVQDSSYRAYRMEWRFGDFQYQGKHYLSKRWLASLKDVRLSCQASPHGLLQEIKEPEALRRALDESIDELFKHYEGLPDLADRERLYRLREDVEAWLLSSLYHFYKNYGLAYRLGEVVQVPDKMALDLQAFEVTRYKKLENYADNIATLVTATLPTTTIYAKDSLPMQMENTSAMMMHIPSGWPVYTYDHLEYGVADNKEGILNEITLKQE